MFLIAQKPTSTKTRIKTRPAYLKRNVVGLKNQLPQKQGLRHFMNFESGIIELPLKNQLPQKQGLRQSSLPSIIFFFENS